MNYFIIIDAVTLILGIYIIFVSLRMKKSGKIESTFVAEDEMKKIKDTAGYIAYIYPKSLVFGIVIFVISIVAIVSDCLQKNTVLVICGDDYIRRSNYLVFKYVTKCQRKIC